MASISLLHLRRNSLVKNPNSIQFFSSSSSSSIPPPPNDKDETTPSPPQSQSYFKDLKSSLKQPRPPTKAASFEEIRKNLSEFRNRTAAPPPPGSGISFQDLYNKNVASRGDSSASTGRGVSKLSYDVIRESLKELKKNRPVEVNRGNEMSNRSKLTDNLFGPAKSPPVYGGGSLPAKVFGKQGNNKRQGGAGEMKTKFLRMYTYTDLGDKLKMLRPEEAKDKKGKWFSFKELTHRLTKLRDVEDKESELDPKPFNSIRESLQKLAFQGDDKKKIHRIDILGQLGGTPNYMLSPPKDNLVEKYFHPDNMSSAEKMKIELKRVRDEFKMSESDCGSSRVQVAQLTTKIKHLSSTLHKKDKHSRKGLQAMVQQRKKLLKYLRRTDWDSYCFVLDKLALRDNPDYKN